MAFERSWYQCLYNLEPPPTSDTKWCKKYGGVFRRLWYIVPMVEFRTIQLSVNIPTQSKRTYTNRTYLHIISKHNGCFWPQWIYIFMLALNILGSWIWQMTIWLHQIICNRIWILILIADCIGVLVVLFSVCMQNMMLSAILGTFDIRMHTSRMHSCNWVQI